MDHALGVPDFVGEPIVPNGAGGLRQSTCRVTLLPAPVTGQLIEIRFQVGHLARQLVLLLHDATHRFERALLPSPTPSQPLHVLSHPLLLVHQPRGAAQGVLHIPLQPLGPPTLEHPPRILQSIESLLGLGDVPIAVAGSAAHGVRRFLQPTRGVPQAVQ